MTVVGITGHQDLTGPTATTVCMEIGKALRVLSPPIIGLTSLAAGADQLFADRVLAAGGTLHLIQPCCNYVETFAGHSARRDYTRLRRRCTTVKILDFDTPSDEAFLAAGIEIARRSDWLFAVWDGTPARGLGGTADIVEYSRTSPGPDKVVVIWPDGAARSG